MCYPKPGPRCSSHAKAELDKADKDLEQFLLKTTSLTPEQAYNQYDSLLTRKKQAQALYDSTPAGQASLEEAINETTGSLKETLQNRKLAGERLRRTALTAYKQTVTASKTLPTLEAPQGWEVFPEITSSGETTYRVYKEGIDLSIQQNKTSEETDAYVEGEVRGKPARLKREWCSMNERKLLAQVGHANGVKDPFGMLMDAEQLGLEKEEVRDLIQIIDSYESQPH
jgi:hypothetical protein